MKPKKKKGSKKENTSKTNPPTRNPTAPPIDEPSSALSSTLDPFDDPLLDKSKCLDKIQAGIFFPVLVILNLTTNTYPGENEYYKRMIIQRYNISYPDPVCNAGDLRFVSQQGFWYLEVFPVSSSQKDCLITDPTQLLRKRNDSNLPVNPANESSCNLYDFCSVIFNDLDEGASVHFHGLTPPSNMDGVPFISNTNIHPRNWQQYRSMKTRTLE